MLWLCKGKIRRKSKAVDTNSFIVYIKTDNVYKDIAKQKKNVKVTGLMKDGLGSKIMKIKSWFVGLRAKSYSYYLIADVRENKKAKDTRKCVIKRKITFEN